MATIKDIIQQSRTAMEKGVDSAKREFGTIRAGKASPNMLDVVRVEVYGQQMALNQVASVAAPEPRLLLVTPYDKGQAKVIEKAIRESDLGLEPSNMGGVIRVPLPQFTLIGATTHAGRLPKPLLDRFGFVCQLRSYTLDEMSQIIQRSAARLGVAIDAEGVAVVARASRGTPRIANRLLRRVRDAAANIAADGGTVLVGSANARTYSGVTITGSLARATLAHPRPASPAGTVWCGTGWRRPGSPTGTCPRRRGSSTR